MARRTDGKTLPAAQPLQRCIDLPALTTLSPRALQLAGTLQVTLDPHHQLGRFLAVACQHLPIDGLLYTSDEGGHTFSFGDTTVHRVTFALRVARQSLGRLRVYSAGLLEDRQLALLADLLTGLLYPLRNALRYVTALELASCDPLTGLQNRRAMEHALQREIDLARRQGAPLSLLILDADHFKHFNDAHGHTYGDEVLRTLAASTAAAVRGSDLLYRYGGEEFVILASHTARAAAVRLGERIRRQVAAVTTVAGRPVELSVSIGLTALRESDSEQSFFERADRALYRAKQGGRNRLMIA